MSREDGRETALHALALAFEGQPDLIAPEGRIGFLRARPHPMLFAFQKRLVCQQDFQPIVAELESAGIRWQERLDGKFSVVLLLPDRQKEQTLADLARSMDLLEEGGTLVVSLHNDWGARRFEKLLAELAGEVGSISKHHCRVFWARKTSTLRPDLMQEWLAHGESRLVSGGRFWSRPGLFSWDEIDEGSRLLTGHLPERIHGAVADLGSGWGYLSDFLLRTYPAIRSLDVFEADRIALECAEKNLGATASPAKVRYHWSDVRAGVGALQFDYVIMNAPFHEGRRPDPMLGLRFIEAAADALKPGGELWLVANRHLPYEKHLQSALALGEIVAQSGPFKVMRGVRAERTPELQGIRLANKNGELISRDD
jgi:16S rRNA (guanine1207-N2)-methyltransferase